MAFVRTDFNPGASTGTAPSIHTYTTEDTIATANTSGYFNEISDILAVGDLIYLQTSTGGTRVAVLAQVLSNASGVVDIADGTVLAATDTD
jgi:hypothetical protein